MKHGFSSALPATTRETLDSLKGVDVVIGIPSYNCAHTINYVIYQTARGLTEYLPGKRAMIMVSDGGSCDGTLEVVRAMKLPTETKIIPTRYGGVSGKGTALKAVFEAMIQLGAQAVMVVDSDLRSIVPQWVDLLLSAPLEGTGLVTPLYERHKYDGTITKFLCYPFTRTLYGRRIRQPIGGDFGLSRDLVENLLSSSLWNTPYIPRFGIDIFETHTALSQSMEVKEACLGSKIHSAKDPSKHLASMFQEVAGAMFCCTEIYEDQWRSIQGSRPVELIEGEVPLIRPEAVEVDLRNLLQEYRAGFERFKSTFERVLDLDVLHSLADFHRKSMDNFGFPSEEWAKCVYSFAAAFKKETDLPRRTHLLEALRYLWMGKVANFVIETRELDTGEAENLILEEAQIFEELKPYLADIY
ncbi:hypothetical protein GWN63_00865 [Candidatus Bathyarchaeota archaeon]|nr:hypothetical protein [Candidatus Bathyarchaeota archaeon]NIU80788.1 hypothetical protein [Candidatus Bathyarchaeota archaeon]NIV67413.1 hypothetical protein [Candidatus Bathyarchaeota archaeon]NIW15957.1 hypothetical protein [Candidatus Bathyarchaeota archaeon]NIW34059.1 hypothetical protein [Candidatus Bathyarchaeota archaeon]